MHNATKRPRPAGAGRKPGGPNGEVRDQILAVKYAPSERPVIDALLRQHGLPTHGGGIRDLLLQLAAREGIAA